MTAGRLGGGAAALLATLCALHACQRAPDVVAPDVVAPDPAAPATLELHVRTLCSADPPRNHDFPRSLLATSDYVADQFRATGGDVRSQDFIVDSETYRNVRVLFGPQQGPRIVVGAHYDVAGDFPGADDNASGVAVLIALAHLLGATRLDRQVELVAYSLEEPPYFGTSDMGSAHHARLLAERGVEVGGMICLEMVGFFSDAEGSQKYPIESLRQRYPSAGNFIAVVGRERDRDLVRRVHAAMAGVTALGVEKLVAPTSMPGLGLSDHRNYWSAGYDAVMVTDTAFFRNPHYHSRRDTPEKLDYNRMSQVTAAVFAAVTALASS